MSFGVKSSVHFSVTPSITDEPSAPHNSDESLFRAAQGSTISNSKEGVSPFVPKPNKDKCVAAMVGLGVGVILSTALYEAVFNPNMTSIAEKLNLHSELLRGLASVGGGAVSAAITSFVTYCASNSIPAPVNHGPSANVPQIQVGDESTKLMEARALLYKTI